MGIAGYLVENITNFIGAVGYGGVFLLMVLESMIFPVPSEAVMPFAGFLVASKQFTLAGVILVSTLASLTGSLISYCIGQWGGEAIIIKWGKYFLLDQESLKKTHKFFSSHGPKAIFIGRLIPVVRHLISLPAGLGRMNLAKFCLYTVLGAAIWNGFLTIVGIYLRQNWDKLINYGEVIDMVIFVLLLIFFAYFIGRHIKAKKRGL